MTASSPSHFTVRWLGTAAKQPETHMVWLTSAATPLLHGGKGRRVALSMRFDPRRTPWSVACDDGVVLVPKRRGFLFGPAVGVTA
jgi:hypothetical protein